MFMKKIHTGKGTCLINRKYIHIGNDCRFGRNCRIEAVKEYAGEFFNPSLTIGESVSMEDNVHIGCAQSVTIGCGTMIGSRVLITDHSHGDTVRESLSIRPALRPLKTSPVVIGRNVWICEGVSILPGVTLGDGVIVGANAVVTHSFPDGVVIAGCPAKIIRKIEDSDAESD